jgi:capsular exopolysaccharide synthesis family protein
MIPENPVQRVARVLRMRYWTILACTTISTSLFLLYAAWQPRLYRATANLAIYRDAGTVSIPKDVTPELGDADEYTVSLETQLQILKSRTIALSVVRDLGLARNTEFIRDTKSGELDAGSNADADVSASPTESAAVAAVLLGLQVDPVKETRVVHVSFTGADRRLDAALVNALVDHFIEDSIRSRYEGSQRAAQFLSGQLADLRTKVEQSQEKLVKYERQHNIVGIDENQNVVITKLEELNKQLTAAEADRMEREALYQTISSGTLDEIPEMKSSEALQSLRLREAELKNEYAQASTTYGPNYPKVLEIQNRVVAIEGSIQAELKRLAGRASEEYQASLRRENKLRAAFESQKAKANRLNESAIQYGLLKREVDSNRQLYDSLQQRMKVSIVAAGLRSSNIRLIDAAEPSRLPVSPNLPKSGSLGLFVGFLISAVVIGLRENMDRALRDPNEIETFTAMPSLALIPERPQARGRMFGRSGRSEEDIVCLTQPRSAMAEAYRALGTSIMLASSDLKTLLITSPLPGEGKTTTAANTAVVLAQQGKRVLVVDADLRKPALHVGFHLSNDSGLSNILSGQAGFDQVDIPNDSVPNLTVLTAGPVHPTPAEVLGSAKMRELMRQWRDKYDYIIIDTPPVLAVTDAMRLSREVDSVLLILRSGGTRCEALTRACDLFNQSSIPVLGIVVNRVNFRSAGPYYSYYPELAKAYYQDDAGPDS